MSLDPAQVETIFTSAVALGSDSEREAFLTKACGMDTAMLARVQTMLNAHESKLSGQIQLPDVSAEYDAALKAPTETFPPPAVPLEGPGTRIGHYKLLEQIGEGGMGVVYMAEQETPVRRRVALKIIKPGMDSRQVIARFEAERQALAIMDHPNIARVFDAGTTGAGRPYFVMEMVQGIPITQFCDNRKLTLRQRLELFVPVCQAVQHAHTKGIIHRDLKPSNVLVMVYDGVAVPKVIDFGIAKALHQRLTDKTVVTSFGTMVGTPEYMSPEQTDMDMMGADARCDIYSLGVLLYELLTGTTPLEIGKMREGSYEQVMRTIRELEPPKPSTRLRNCGDRLATLAAVRGTEPRKLTAFIAGDLDWIVMKALEKDRSRRYETANGLSRDIQRYLSDEPVEASPPSAAYRFRKLLRRHRRFAVALLAFTTFLVLLAAGSVIAAAVFRQQEQQQRQLADNNARLAERNALLAQEREVQRAEADRLRQRADDLAAVALMERDKAIAERNRADEQIAIEASRPPEKTLRELYSSFNGQVSPEALAALTHLVDFYTSKPTRSADAIKFMYEELALRKKLYGENHQSVPQVLNALATYLRNSNKAEAANLSRQALDILEKTPDIDPWRVAGAKVFLSEELIPLGKYEEAEQLITDAYSVLMTLPRSADGYSYENYVGQVNRDIATGDALYAAWNKPEERAAWKAAHPRLSKTPESMPSQ
jgi:serine/threonine protein kinase